MGPKAPFFWAYLNAKGHKEDGEDLWEGKVPEGME
jgi:hypothetical protein